MILYLGAGINGPKMLWNAVLDCLVRNSGLSINEQAYIKGCPNDLQAAILKNILGDQYIPIIQDFIYSKGNIICI
ncbi:MAG: hypothetical protein IJ745_03655, partial [Bacteroidales bacterium]|nr:hypothetical protein [Bacteroidales bacterium]